MTRHFKTQLLIAFLFFSSILGGVFYLTIDYAIHQTEDYILKGYLQGIVDLAATQTNPTLPNQYAISSQLIKAEDLPIPLNNQTAIIYESLDRNQYRYIRQWPPNDLYIVATIDERIVSDFEEKETYILGIMFLMVISIVMISWLVALWLSHIIAQPLLTLTHVINSTAIDAKTPANQPLYGQDRKDEIGLLSRAFSTLLDRTQSVLHKERAFSHHVSHELRSPLAVINNATALLKHSIPPTEPSNAKNLERIRKATKLIDHRIKLFLHLGHEQQTKQTVHLVNAWKTTISSIQQQRVEAINIQKQSISDETLDATPSLMHTLLENSLFNAVQYGYAIEVELNHQQYRINNLISEEYSDTQPNRFGYGVAIIQRVCDASGWDLAIEHTHDEFNLTVKFSQH